MIFVEETPPMPPTDQGGEEVIELSPVSQPVQVQHTDAVYDGFKTEYGEDQAAVLQAAWGDAALPNERIARAYIADHQELNRAYAEYQTDSGGVTLDGLEAMARHVAGDRGLDAFINETPELEAIYYDHADLSGNLSAVGLYRMLHYLGQRDGYTFSYTGGKR